MTIRDQAFGRRASPTLAEVRDDLLVRGRRRRQVEEPVAAAARGDVDLLEPLGEARGTTSASPKSPCW